MGKRVFTKEQLSAIETKNKSLLVSAAAGSGKTATLTERIIRSITDSENPEDIREMLIVTFTNAAVAELRERITDALKKRLAEEPDNKRIESQIYMLPTARISTIDSFCNDILKNNTERFGISPKYRIADPIEAKILSHSTLSALIGAAYDGMLPEVCTPEEFEELAFCLVGVKNDSALEEVFELLYEKSKSCEDGVLIYRKFADSMANYKDIPIEENPYADFAIRRAKETAQHYLDITEKLMQGFVLTDKYFATLEGDISLLRNILSAKTYTEMKTALSMPFPSLPAIRGEKSEEEQNVFVMRPRMKKALGADIADRYFRHTEEEWREHISALSKLLRTLALFLEKFDSVYFNEKNSRAMLEYSDIERFTYLSLFNADGSPSELALSEREKYSSVYIDEYQDVNAVQNKIFLAVSKEGNRFTVGDIKQSIYGFRSARPDIFAKMKSSYPELENSEDSHTASIFMSKNFRCDKGIVDFVNGIFDNMFNLCRDSIGYVEGDRLEFAKIYDDGIAPPYRRPEVKLFAKDDSSAELFDTEEELSPRDLSPLWVAQKIKELLSEKTLNSGDAIRPKDVAIVLRKDGGRSKLYSDALAALGIPAKAPESKNFFESPEIQLVLCLLNVINNPMRDIYLAGLLLSPIFSFTPDELYLARQTGGASLWDSVKNYSRENPENEKFSSFISTLNRYRAVAEGMRADELLMKLYREAGLLALGAKEGSRENLMLFYNYAKRFESSSFEGLYNFINYVNTVIESGASFSSEKQGEAEDSVTIITVHKSKGLEYPVVFLADAASSMISRNEKNARIAFSEDFGIAMKTRRPGGLALVESPVYNAIIDRNIERSIEEELRVYYVALTRARERLYIVGAPRTASAEDFETEAKLKNIHKSPYSLKELKTFVDILYSQPTNAVISWGSDGERCEEYGDDFGFEDSQDVFEYDRFSCYDEFNLEFESDEERCAFFEDFEDSTSFLDGLSFDSEKHSKREIFFKILNKKIEQWGIRRKGEKDRVPSPELTYDNNLRKELVRRFSYKYPNAHLTVLPEKMSISSLYPTVLDGNEEEPRLSIDETDVPTDSSIGKLPEFITGSSEYESARRGIATHNFMQFFDVESFLENGVEKELERLKNEGFISAENADRVRLREIEMFRKSKLCREMCEAKKLYREFRFSAMLPASYFTENTERKKLFESEKILVQGVIDCIIEDASGNLHLVDYKTDRLSADELRDKSLAQKTLSEKHSLQLLYYSLAIERIFGKHPVSVRVYSLPLGDTVDIDLI